MHTFGPSAPLKDVEEEFGFTPDKIAAVAREAVESGGKVKVEAMGEER